ncbi:pyruvate/2-oxoglutarate dehydrogenase complex, dihydrolipoamide dehydrogenase component [Bernardetia litoralis DSM 6794]|uniref:Pyruvate/2-oxoglutarate dehydrogenase complex, dihydrolipoamide dehydrogenase component n=1 Tax=Bernardetia litoralis (strain ATCC 23117 / DSM 6794 / NBRC 15988 / NCIMB 1366 / Fx l1 / Sio-4) TaxID=880071 RepID=I4AGS8_BERLS|nr:mercuric reductase [Bernardetia litoralis]AFM03163.1 pyruvate/2-oxoglutarate dehydrogenase complex, dihydrolipoamide dehydrogenase component [Bernardetia litoralis DSM 6794]
MKTYDAIIIGTGQAGVPLATKFANEGKKVAIIEKNKIGGTCVNNGCTPTKTYVASARRAFVAKNSKDLGIETKDVKVNLKKIKERKDEIIANTHIGIKKLFSGLENLDFYQGEGSFLSENSIEIKTENGKNKKIEGKQIFINVGGKTIIPKEYQKIDYLTNTSILELEEVPKHLIILGAGYIGLEFSQVFARFGSKVTVLQQNERFLKKEDKDVADEIKKVLEKESITIHTNAQNIKVVQKEKINISFEKDGKEQKIKGSHILISVGRKPNTKNLNLEKAGVKTDERGYIKVNQHFQTNKKHIFALGDCNGKGAFTHTAYNDFEIVRDFIFGKQKRKLADRIQCYAMFIDPPLSRVGINEEQAKQQMKEDKDLKIVQAFRPMKYVARAKEKGETDGMMKILINEKTQKILGATFLGISADETIHGVIDIMYANKSYKTIRDAVHIHPTVSELIPTMLENLKELK